MRFFSAVLLLACAACASRPRLLPFATDGCSLFPDGTSENEELWLHCCKQHDFKYWMGGPKAERLTADREFRACIAAVGRPKTSKWMFRGVRAGGTPYLPTRFRWGYGWRYLRGYKALTDEERKLVDEVRGQ